MDAWYCSFWNFIKLRLWLMKTIHMYSSEEFKANPLTAAVCVYTCLGIGNRDREPRITTCWLRTDLEVGIAEALAGTDGSLDLQDGIAACVLDVELGPHEGADLLNATDHLAGWRRHLHGVHAAGKAAEDVALEGPVQVEHLVLKIVQYLHLEGARPAEHVAGAAVALLVREVHILAQWVLHLEAVLRLEAGEQLQFLDLLRHEQLVQSGQVFQSLRAVGHAHGYRHPVFCNGALFRISSLCIYIYLYA